MSENKMSTMKMSENNMSTMKMSENKISTMKMSATKMSVSNLSKISGSKPLVNKTTSSLITATSLNTASSLLTKKSTTKNNSLIIPVMSRTPKKKTSIRSMISNISVKPKSSGATKKHSSTDKSPKHKKKPKKKVPGYVDPSPYNIPGIKKMLLNPTSQKAIGCVVGDDISAENPWKNVRKELITDNIDLHEDSSEFLALKKEIEMYPENEMLIGWIPGASDTEDFFYIVFTLEAKVKALEIIAREKAELQKKLAKCISRSVGRWLSFGSEDEVLNEIICDGRPLYEIHINARFPMPNPPSKWKMRKVEEMRDGYVELIPDPRYPVEVIEKKRVDISTQVARQLISVASQTRRTYPMNAANQHEHILNEEDTEDHKEHKFGGVEKKVKPPPLFQTDFMMSSVDSISDQLKQNGEVDIYTDDYAKLPHDKRLRMDTSGRYKTFTQFSDYNTKKKNYISSLSWDPFTSGIITVAYANITNNLITNIEEYEPDDCESSVLLWSYTDYTSPKLQLEAPRTVTAVSYCPYKKDLVVGGLQNGQIIIWDITNRLQKSEAKEYLTKKQRDHRSLLRELTHWSKKIKHKQLVSPVLVTKLENSQKDMITDVFWFVPGSRLDHYGNIVYDCDTNDFQMKFLTSCLNGTVSFWDLNINLENIVQKKAKRTRLKSRPSGLEVDISKYVALGKDYKPTLNWSLNKGNNIFPITSLMHFIAATEYDVIDEPSPDVSTRNHYKLSDKQKLPKTTPNLLGSALGQLAQARCATFEYETGEELRTKNALFFEYASVHDGPISVCHVHPFFSNYVLTIGGRIFSIWHIELSRAILWNKSPLGTKYLSGGWTQTHASFIILIRSDNTAEIWDFLMSRKKPFRIVPTTSTMTIYGTTHVLKSRKNTIAISDKHGNLLVLHIPDLFLKLKLEEGTVEAELILDKFVKQTRLLDEWMNNFITRYQTIKESLHYEEVEDEEKIKTALTHSTLIYERKQEDVISKPEIITEIEKMDKIFNLEWMTVQEQTMFQKMFELKGVNLKELEKQKHLLQKKIIERKEFIVKQEKMLSDKDRIFRNAKALLYPKRRLEKIRTYEDNPNENESYIAEYDYIEKIALGLIQANMFKTDYNQFEVQLEKARILRYSSRMHIKMETLQANVGVTVNYVRRLTKVGQL